MTGVPDLAAPVAGWRVWALDVDADGPRLVSPVVRTAWAGRTPMRAACRSGCPRPPSVTCRCGLYAQADVARLRPSRTGRPLVLGCVALWGRVVEHIEGWRGELGYPLVLFTSTRDLPPVDLPPLGEPADADNPVDRSLSRRYGVPVHPVRGLARRLALGRGVYRA